MNLSARTGIFLGLVLATIVACKVFSNPKTNPVAGVIVWLPKIFEGSFGEEETMGPEERRWLPTDTTFYKLTYPHDAFLAEASRVRSLGGEQAEARAEALIGWAGRFGISATLIVAGADSRSLHRPQVCLKAQGWAIDKREIVTLETSGGPLQVMDYHLSMVKRGPDQSALRDEDGNPLKFKAHYVYWWVGPEASTPKDEERVWLETWNSILKGRKERWAYPSVMSWVNEAEGPDASSKTQERIYDYIRRAAPEFQKSLGAEARDDAKPLKAIGA
ncbi:MAG: exosortase-associated EpsI family protein [Verrucomicrobiota bacterium JB023]|nr:exosortase-associated EpsI family protein [Verrucomicrobiota bacterium JB023]